MKQFPIIIDFRGTPGPCPSSIPWEAIAPYDGHAKLYHGGQSLELLAERGGLSPAEAFLVMHGRKWDYKQDVQQLRIEACAFLDTLVRESTIAKVTQERDAALLQNSELRDSMEQRQQILVDFAREEFGDEEGKTWEAPFTVGKFVEMVRDEMRRMNREIAALKERLRLPHRGGTMSCMGPGCPFCDDEEGKPTEKKNCEVPVSDGPCGMLLPCLRHTKDPEDYCKDHGTLKPCRHCLGNKGL